MKHKIDSPTCTKYPFLKIYDDNDYLLRQVLINTKDNLNFVFYFPIDGYFLKKEDKEILKYLLDNKICKKYGLKRGFYQFTKEFLLTII